MTKKQIDLINAEIEKKKFQIEKERRDSSKIYFVALPIILALFLYFLESEQVIYAITELLVFVFLIIVISPLMEKKIKSLEKEVETRINKKIKLLKK